MRYRWQDYGRRPRLGCTRLFGLPRDLWYYHAIAEQLLYEGEFWLAPSSPSSNPPALHSPPV